MEKKAIKRIVIMGISLAILLALGIVYSLVFNDGRWVICTYQITFLT